MRNKLSRISLVLILVVALVMSSATIVFGASASLSVSGGGTVTKGSTVTITCTYRASSIVGVEASIKYDSNILQYKSCSGSLGDTSGYGSAGIVRITASDEMNDHNAVTISATFTAVGTGTSPITVSTIEARDFNLAPLSVSGGSTSVTVSNPAPTVSSNANLSSLKVSAGSLNPAFSPSKTSYTVNVGEDVTVCTISAATADPDATMSVSGSKNLAEGRNVRSVTVTAPNGNKKTYTIVINRGEASEEEPAPGEEEKEEITEGIITTVGETEYLIQETIKPEDVPNGFNLSLAKYEENDIPVIKDGEYKYTLALLKNQENGELGWFFYDEANGTFSISQSVTTAELIGFYSDSNEAKKDDSAVTLDKTTMILAGILGGTLLVLIIVIIVLQVKIIKRSNKKKAEKLAKEERAAIAAKNAELFNAEFDAILEGSSELNENGEYIAFETADITNIVDAVEEAGDEEPKDE